MVEEARERRPRQRYLVWSDVTRWIRRYAPRRAARVARRSSAVAAKANGVGPGWCESPLPRIDGQSQGFERFHTGDRLRDVTDENRCRRIPSLNPKNRSTGVELDPLSVGERDRDRAAEALDANRTGKRPGITENVAPVSTSMRTVTAFSADSVTR